MTYARVRNRIKIINQKNEKRHILSVFRSNRSISASLIAPDGNMVKSISSMKVSTKGTPIEKAKLTGAEIAKIAKDNKITTVVFDRNKYAYHGQVKALADGAREAGLKF